MDRTVIVGAAVALLGALVAFVFLPARARGRPGELARGRRGTAPPQRTGAAARPGPGHPRPAGRRRDVQLTYNAVARPLWHRHRTHRALLGLAVDAVTDALAEVFRAHPVPDTGDLRQTCATT
jgi:hypothetical protein